MSDFSLDDLNRALEAKYKPFVFTAGRNKFTLNQVLSLPKEQRTTVRAILESMENTKDTMEEEQILEALKQVLSYVVEDDKVDKLLEVLEYDLVKVSILFETWLGATQVGEA